MGHNRNRGKHHQQPTKGGLGAYQRDKIARQAAKRRSQQVRRRFKQAQPQALAGQRAAPERTERSDTPQNRPKAINPIEAAMRDDSPPSPQEGVGTPQPQTAPHVPGSGVSPREATSSGMTPRQEHALIHRAVGEGWVQGPWPTHWTPADFQAKAREGMFNIQEETALAILRDVKSEDPRLRQVAARNAISMVGQNISCGQHGERLDYYERALEHRVATSGGPMPAVGINIGGDKSGGGNVNIAVFLPDNGRDPEGDFGPAPEMDIEHDL